MFEKLYALVKENLGKDTLEKAQVPQKFYDAIVNEASGTIIDVLKSQIEKGKHQDLWNVFMYSCVKNVQLIRSISNKYAMRLNTNYGIAIDKAKYMAEDIIPSIMEKFVFTYRNGLESDKQGIFTLFNNLSGNTINYEVFLSKTTPSFSA